MNAPAAATRFLRREDYAPTIDALLPGVQGDELTARCSLLLMRDHAMSTKRHCSEEAWGILDQVERIAGGYALQPMKLAELAEIRRVMIMLVAAASDLEGIFQPPLQIGEAHEGG